MSNTYGIYEFIRGLVSKFEPNSKDEFEWLDKFLG